MLMDKWKEHSLFDPELGDTWFGDEGKAGSQCLGFCTASVTKLWVPLNSQGLSFLTCKMMWFQQMTSLPLMFFDFKSPNGKLFQRLYSMPQGDALLQTCSELVHTCAHMHTHPGVQSHSHHDSDVQRECGSCVCFALFSFPSQHHPE